MHPKITRRAALAGMIAVTGGALSHRHAQADDADANVAVIGRFIGDVLTNRRLDVFNEIVSDDLPPQYTGDATGRDALWQRLLQGWQDVDDDHATITIAVSDAYAHDAHVTFLCDITWNEEGLLQPDTGHLFVLARVEGGKIVNLWEAWLWY